MRNIDFRGKAVGSGRWIHGDLVWNGRVPAIFEDADQENGCITVKESTLGVNTGAKDKQGHEIYEGDILKHTNMPVYYTVVWAEELCSFVLYNPEEKHEEFSFGELSPLGRMLRLFPFEIVGNIYDNPGLMKGGAV